MSKKLLNEAQVRRFMGLAGIQPSVVSSRINEWYKVARNEGEYNEEEDELPPMDDEAPMDDEMPPMDDEMPAMDDEMPPEEAPAMDPQALAMELIDALAPVFEKHGVELAASEDGGGVAPASDMDMDMDMDAVAPEGGGSLEPMEDEEEEEEEMDMAESNTTPVKEDEEMEETLTQEEIVNEVARRVIKRIRKARVAKKNYKKTLGKK